MKTSLIRYRVADFLAEHPPFDSISLEDLLSFSDAGRVLFHEDDILLFSKGDSLSNVIWVIQQGRVELIDQTAKDDRLWDVLGPGDILGLPASSKEPLYPHSARTATEVILYSFERSAFESLVSKYPAASRFLTAHLSATQNRTKALRAPVNRDRLMTEREKQVWLNDRRPWTGLTHRRPVTCAPAASRKAVVNLLNSAHAGMIVVTSPEEHPIGIITYSELSQTNGADAQASNLMRQDFRLARPHLTAPDYLMELMRSRSRRLLTTEDGTQNAPLQSVITDDDLTLDCGRNPALLVWEIQRAETSADLAYLRSRTETLISESLVGPSTVEWLTQMIGEVNAAMVERVVDLVQTKPAPEASCWFFVGCAGRQEFLTPDVPELILVYADPAPDQQVKTAHHFNDLFNRVNNRLAESGLRIQEPSSSSLSVRALSLGAWKEFYARRIQQPILNAIYSAREYFDFRIVCGDSAIGLEIQNSVLAEVERSAAFIPVLANDTLGNLPPLTFFREQTVEADGTLRQTLDLHKSAINPIVDASRVFAFADKDISDANTFSRLGRAAERLPHFASALDDAAEALRILLYYQAIGYSSADKENGINPSRLSRFEQRMLKSAFDSTRRFLDLTYSLYNFSRNDE